LPSINKKASRPASDQEKRAGLRLQKYLADCGVASRRKAEDLIAAGRVAVNGVVQTAMGQTIDPQRDKITVDGQPLRAEQLGVLLLHKPKNVVTSKSDPEGRPTVMDYLTKKYKSYFPVGRLDFESTGLVIMTNDGDLADRLLHPRYELPKSYIVTVAGRLPESVMQQLANGVNLEDGVIKPKVQLLVDEREQTQIKVTIIEGRNRIIRRMMERVGYPVKSLLRISHGPLTLGTLRPGQIQVLTEREYQKLRQRVMGE
jgi:23S rRNA pseudouridine2605 synthase